MENNSLRILLVSPLPPPSGGIASWTKNYINFCNSVGVSVNIINTALIGTRLNNINNKRVIIDEILRTKKILLAMHKELRYKKPDIIHINSSCGKFGIIRDYVIAFLAKLKKTPVLVHFHCNIEDQINSKLSRYFFKKLVNISNKVLVLNQNSQNYVMETADTDAKILPNFISQNWIRKTDKSITLNVKKILFVGHINKQKGAEEIFQVAKKFKDKTFIMVGPLDSKYSNLELPNNIEIAGAISSNMVRDYLDSADIFLFPTRSEGFSIALAEAMARGVPIITTSVGANIDMIERNGGIVVPIGDIKGIEEAIIKLEDINIRKNMSRWNIDKVKGSYTIDQVMDKLFEIYGEIS
ncbi:MULTISPECIES: glycosyltransferase family 4 protein [unclassified Paenibacillus]|uniref:glycosyltransferase family 4 protein n=1 Tax=unclassified Paenibacillus TaxID=185978 RepID=UPI001AEB9808|nr:MULTISPECIES: glycosyltransferase family 4 protein [unclassified Paenibacillus]MBP1154398.1 glycosyltransferase involved in cell wall biosynthesis [Paenibacillus sp. PvP091]MBP1170218.1 glycosyltransferase involved in cell wall biosynthesis [Paenibacillus sp. PvR098]MBP2441246.1 glycosyltransferase involved in cell wall biosynthesis [Paenibacillus sp. PvP052]